MYGCMKRQTEKRPRGFYKDSLLLFPVSLMIDSGHHGADTVLVLSRALTEYPNRSAALIQLLPFYALWRKTQRPNPCPRSPSSFVVELGNITNSKLPTLSIWLPGISNSFAFEGPVVKQISEASQGEMRDRVFGKVPNWGMLSLQSECAQLETQGPPGGAQAAAFLPELTPCSLGEQGSSNFSKEYIQQL